MADIIEKSLIDEEQLIENKEKITDGKHTELSTQSTKKKKSLRNNRFRFIFLALICLCILGVYNIQQFLTPLQGQIMSRLKINEAQFNRYYSVAQIPNIILSFPAGFIIDHIGCSKSLIISNLATLVSQFIVFVGIELTKNELAVYIGQIMLGTCLNFITIAASAVTMQWFKNKELSMAFGLTVTFTSLGQGMNQQIIPYLYEATNHINNGFLISFLFGFILLGISIIASIFAFTMDKIADKQEGVQKHDIHSEERPSLRNVLRFKYLFWFVIISIACSQCSWLTLSNDQNFAMQALYPTQISQTTAGTILGFGLYLGFTCPFIGIVYDKIGLRGLGGVFGQGAILISLILMIVISQDSSVALITFTVIFENMGINFYQTGFWPVVTILVPEKLLGSAFGMQGSLCGLTNFLSAYFFGDIIVATKSTRGGYFYPIMYCIFFTSLSAFLALCLCILDFKYNNGKTNKKQKVQVKELSHRSTIVKY